MCLERITLYLALDLVESVPLLNPVVLNIGINEEKMPNPIDNQNPPAKLAEIYDLFVANVPPSTGTATVAVVNDCVHTTFTSSTAANQWHAFFISKGYTASTVRHIVVGNRWIFDIYPKP